MAYIRPILRSPLPKLLYRMQSHFRKVEQYFIFSTYHKLSFLLILWLLGFNISVVSVAASLTQKLCWPKFNVMKEDVICVLGRENIHYYIETMLLFSPLLGCPSYCC